MTKRILQKTIKFTEMNISDLIPFLEGLRQQQTRRGEEHGYAPIEPTIFPPQYTTPVFTMKDIDALVGAIEGFPKEKIKLQRCDKQQRLSWVVVNRRQALFELLNQAVWRYQSGKAQKPLKKSDLLARIRGWDVAIKKAQECLFPPTADACKHTAQVLNMMGAPIIQTLAGLNAIRMCLDQIDVAVRHNTKKAKTPPNTGDAWFCNLMNDVCEIWLVIFQKDVSLWSSKRQGENVVSGSMLPFVQAVLKKAGAEKNGWTVKRHVNLWCTKHRAG